VAGLIGRLGITALMPRRRNSRRVPREEYAFVAAQQHRSGPRRTAAQGTHVQLGQQRSSAGLSPAWPGADHHDQWPAQTVDQQWVLVVSPPARATDGVIVRFVRPDAALLVIPPSPPV
jgi:hypothetical protein